MSGTSQNKRFRIVHYLNQFFGGVGGEEQADCEPRTIQGSKGPGRLFEKFFREQNVPVEIVATVICGDSYFAENQEKGLGDILPGIRGAFLPSRPCTKRIRGLINTEKQPSSSNVPTLLPGWKMPSKKWSALARRFCRARRLYFPRPKAALNKA